MLLMIMMDACISLYQLAFNFLQETKFKKKFNFLPTPTVNGMHHLCLCVPRPSCCGCSVSTAAAPG